MLNTIIAGVFSVAAAVAAALVSVWFKHRLESRRTRPPANITDERTDNGGFTTRVDRAHTGREPIRFRSLLILLPAFGVGLLAAGFRLYPPYHEAIFGALKYGNLPPIGHIVFEIVVFAVILTLARRHWRRAGGHWSFQLEVVAMWLAYIAGWLIVHPSSLSYTIDQLIMWWLISSILGGLIVIWKHKRIASS